MFGWGPFYFSTIRKMVIVMGNMINDLQITRTDNEGNTLALIKVPLSYAPKNKMLARIDADPALNRQTAILLPRMSFELGRISYDGTRKLNTISRHVKKDDTDANKLKAQYNPVPYNFDFNVYVYVKNQEDGTKIIEQILPFFTPDWTVTVNLIPEMNVAMDIPITLMDIQGPEDRYEGPMPERRTIIWTLSFQMKGYFFGPITSKPIIKVSKTQFYVPPGQISDSVGTSDILGRITVTPGLDANGNPTTIANNSIPWSQIEVDDDYGFIIDSEGPGIILED